MIRCTIELLPGGDESRARTIGLVEIANLKTHPDGTADYGVVLKKTPPWDGALRAAWKKAKIRASVDGGSLDLITPGEDDDSIYALASGHHRTRRGPYDLLFRALASCGLAGRNR